MESRNGTYVRVIVTSADIIFIQVDGCNNHNNVHETRIGMDKTGNPQDMPQLDQQYQDTEAHLRSPSMFLVFLLFFFSESGWPLKEALTGALRRPVNSFSSDTKK